MFTYSEDHPTMQQLVKMRYEVTGIATNWYELGLELVGSEILKVIRADHHNNVTACCDVMFEKWLEQTPNASWSQLITALDKIKMTFAAKSARKLFQSGK